MGKGFFKNRSVMRFFPMLIPLYPLLAWLGQSIHPTMSWSRRDNIQSLLHRSGYFYVPEEIFFAAQIASGFIASMFMTCLMIYLHVGVGVAWIIAIVVAWNFGFMTPARRLRTQLIRYRDEINRQWPDFMDLLVICLCAGMGFDSALRMTVDSLPQGAVKQEWERYVNDVRTGQTKQNALQALANRVEIKPVVQFVSSLSFSEKCGSSLVKQLQLQSSQIRSDQAINTEEHALKAPVKMLLPLSLCFFPCTFLVISYPIVKQLLGTV